MTVLLSKKGTWTTRYCNAKCHDAEGEKCECICGGLNHGVGYEQATVNVLAYRIPEDVDIKDFQMVLTEVLNGEL